MLMKADDSPLSYLLPWSILMLKLSPKHKLYRSSYRSKFIKTPYLIFAMYSSKVDITFRFSKSLEKKSLTADNRNADTNLVIFS